MWILLLVSIGFILTSCSKGAGDISKQEKAEKFAKKCTQ